MNQTLSSADYQKLASRTEPTNIGAIIDRFDPRMVRLTHAADGLATEVGEFTDVIKRTLFYGKPMGQAEITNMKEELGDIMWYIALAANTLGFTMEEIMAANIRKLNRRFPDKFTEDQALVRDLDAEYRALENRA